VTRKASQTYAVITAEAIVLFIVKTENRMTGTFYLFFHSNVPAKIMALLIWQWIIRGKIAVPAVMRSCSLPADRQVRKLAV